MNDRVTLAEVLEAKAQWNKLEQEPIATARQVHEHDSARARFATLAAYYFEQTRAALERLELENAARVATGSSPDTPVRVLPTSDPPELVTVHYEDSDCRMVEVGRDWRPGVL